MRSLSKLYPLLIAALLALATYWLQFVVSNERPAGLGKDRGDPDTIIETLHVDKFDAQGKLSMNIDADELKHFPLDDSVDLQKPRVRFISARGDSTWHSDKGRVTEQGDRIRLFDNVRGVRAATPTTLEQVLTTTEAILLTHQEIAQIPAPLTLTQGATRIDATRGEWNNIEGLLKLQQIEASFPRKTN